MRTLSLIRAQDTLNAAARRSLALLGACLVLCTADSSAPAAGMPLVYEREDTGSGHPAPPLPDFDALPSIPHLPDPFKMADGSRISRREQWTARRAEIKAILEQYDVGKKPGKPGMFKATLEGNRINFTVGEGSNTFNMTATINRPAGAPDGPIPVIIGINSPTGSLPGELFSSRGIATITYQANQVAPTAFGASITSPAIS